MEPTFWRIRDVNKGYFVKGCPYYGPYNTDYRKKTGRFYNIYAVLGIKGNTYRYPKEAMLMLYNIAKRIAYVDGVEVPTAWWELLYGKFELVEYEVVQARVFENDDFIALEV